MTEAEAITLRDRAVKVAQKFVASDSEDVAHDILLSFIEKGRGQTINQALIDRLRKASGDKRYADNYERRKLFASPSTLYRDDGTPRRFMSRLPNPEDSLIQKETLARTPRALKLFYIEGLKQCEIAKQTGLTPGRVCQQIAAETERFRRRNGVNCS